MSVIVRSEALGASREEEPAPPSTSTKEANTDILSGLPDILTTEQVADTLQMSSAGVRQMCREGSLQSFRCGAQWRIPKLWLCDFMLGGGNG
jgi:excisionase family DNA binding protein